MPDSMEPIVAFFHEHGHLTRTRELREALNQFETRMPERIKDRVLSKLPAEEHDPTGWSRFQMFLDFRTTGFHGLGWERRTKGSAELMEWVGFSWYYERNHDHLSYPQDTPLDPSRWVGWWKLGVEQDSPQETQLHDKACTLLDDRLGGLPDQRLIDAEPLHGDSWPYFHSVPAAEVTDVLRVDTDEFATALSKILPEIRRAVEQIT